MPTDPTTVQTLIFDKQVFKSVDRAKSWAKGHEFKSSKVDETEDSFRLRQREPGEFNPDSFRTIELTDGVKAVVGKLKGQGSAEAGPKDLFLPIHGPTRRLQPAEHAEASDGTVRLRFFPAGLPAMDEEDWRQFEITPENMLTMVERANALIASGKKVRINYGHNASGPKAGEAIRFEADSQGVYGIVKWTPAARAAIKSDPSEWDGFSPEFFVERVMDEASRKPQMFEGREVLRPYEITGGGLTNTPAMPELEVAANKATPADAGARIGNAPSGETAKMKEREMEIPKETLARLGLADGASPEDVNLKLNELADKLAELTKPAPVVETPPAPAAASAEPAPTKEEVAAMIEAKAKKLADEAAHTQRVAAAVQKAVESGKVTAAQRPGAEKFAAADIEAFEKFVESSPVLAPVAKGAKPAAATSKTKRFATDRIGDAALALDPERVKLDQAAHAYAEENHIEYAQAVLAVSRR